MEEIANSVDQLHAALQFVVYILGDLEDDS